MELPLSASICVICGFSFGWTGGPLLIPSPLRRLTMRHCRAALIALLCLPLTACFEEPVREHVHLTIRNDDPVIITVVQEVA